jgi:UDPglucose 6-dehydrogenase
MPPHTIAVFGAGYVGLIQAIALHSLGNKVYLVDIDERRLDLIRSRKAPIFEKGLDAMLASANFDTFIPTSDAKEAIEHSNVLFICVGTPSEGTTQDTRALEAVSKTIGTHLNGFKVVVVKSTVLPGTTEDIVGKTIETTSGLKAGVDFGLAMNPEFLREGTALHDFFHGDRTIIGVEDERSKTILSEVYDLKESTYYARIKEAELIKYASNSFLALKISFANEIGNLCKKLGLDAYRVLELTGKDSRIGEKFLESGIGYGGSCFPKDVAALIGLYEKEHLPLRTINAAHEANERQHERLIGIMKRSQEIKGAKVGVLGLAFKKGTDDVRESPAFRVIRALIDEGAKITAYDPQAMVRAKAELPMIRYADSAQSIIDENEIIVILTDWPEFEKLDYKDKPVFLGRKLNVKGEGITW